MVTVFSRSLWRLSMMSLTLLLVQADQHSAHGTPPPLPVPAATHPVSQGTASFSTSGPSGSQTLTITTSANALINWQSFDIGQNYTTKFVQPSSSSVVWNQINDSSPSQILGNLNANGYVVLQNQSGLYIGGQATITAHGLLMTTAQPQSPNVFSGGAWQFNAPPPLAQIINYGQINITGGGAAYLIASDIVNGNGGTISAPGGKIGLYAGQQVLISSSPDGRGLSAQVTLPQGSVDNQGKLIADAGSIALQAKTVNQGGLVQANSVQNVNGVIELLASDSVTLGAGSAISAQGDTTGISSGGSVTIQSGNTFSDSVSDNGKGINVAGGAQGGAGGQILISAPQMSTPLSTLTGKANDGYAKGSLALGADNILVNSDGSPAANTLVLKDSSVSDWSTTFSQISLNATYDLTMTAGTTIAFDAGRIILNAATMDLAGTLRANSRNEANGVIEVNASDSLTLENTSIIEAHGDNSSVSASPGGFVVLHAGNTFTDNAGSKINVAGTGGGQHGIIEVFGNNLDGTLGDPADVNSIQSNLGNYFALLVNPYNLTLSDGSTGPTPDPTVYNVNVYDLAAYSQIDFHALNNIELNTMYGPDPNDPSSMIPVPWSLKDYLSTPAWLSLQAGNNITLDDQSGIYAGKNWNVNLRAGTSLPAGTQPAPGNDGIYLNGDAYIQSQNGDLNLWAANEVQVSGGDIGGITTTLGGNITVTTQYGDVNTGNNTHGYNFGLNRFGLPNLPATYYAVDPQLGGISTAAGGNVSIAAGGNVISFLPKQTIKTPNSPDYVNAQNDAGSGAFGSNPGNVTITAGGNVYGHYVVANGMGSISAGLDIGASLATLQADRANEFMGFALSLIKGGWNVYAPKGSIYVQDVRNPNGIFGEPNNSSPDNYYGFHFFDYDPSASLMLEAAHTVEITGFQAPHTPNSNPGVSIPILLPPSLNVIAGDGGFILDTSVILFPSPVQNLNLITQNGGNFGQPNSVDPKAVSPIYLEMSDSVASDGRGPRWVGVNSFLPSDKQPNDPAEQLNSTPPVTLSISGSMNALNLYTTKATEIAVGVDMINSGFVGMNLLAKDETTINVSGQIYFSPVYTFVSLTAPITSANPLQPNLWDSVFNYALNPDLLPQLATLQANNPLVIGVGGLFQYLKLNNYLLFVGTDLTSKLILGTNPGFVYDPANLQLGFAGNMTTSLKPQQINALEQKNGPMTVLVVDAAGNPTFDVNGHLITAPYNFSAASTIATLNTESLKSAPSGAGGLGLQIGGPGAFYVHAASIDLGNSQGIGSAGWGKAGLTAAGFDYASLKSLLPVAAEGGASVTVIVDGNLSMATSGIFSRDGGNVTVQSLGGQIDLSRGTFVFPTDDCYGIWTVGHSDVSVTASGNINIGSSRIATFNGGDVLVKSENGDVSAGSGVNIALLVYGFINNPLTGTPAFVTFGDLTDIHALNVNPAFYGSGILAEYPTPAFQSPGGTRQPGNITVLTPNGNITSSLGGVSQFALNQTVSGNSTLTLTAGDGVVDYTKNQEAMVWNGILYPIGTLLGLQVDATTFEPKYANNLQTVNWIGKSWDPGTLLGVMVGGNFKPENNIMLGDGGVVGVTVNVSAGNVQGLIIGRKSVNITTTESFNGTVLSSGTANFSGGGSISGTVVGIGGINVSGNGAVTASLLSQNVSVGTEAAQSTLGKSSSASSTSSSAAGESNSGSKQLASTTTDDDENQKRKLKPALSRHLKRVTVILPKAI